MQNLYFAPEVQETIEKHLGKIRGEDNRDDAKQEAYHAIADEGPITVDDAVDCVKRAIDRYRKRLSREAAKDAEGWVSNSERRRFVSAEWADFAVHYLGIDDDEYDDSGTVDSFADKRNYDTASFPVRKNAFR